MQGAKISYGPTGGIEIDHGDADLSAAIREGHVEIMIGEDFSGRHHGPERPQGYMRSLDFKMTMEDARVFRDWLTRVLDTTPTT